MKTLYIIRGVAGSGKTTFVEELTSTEDKRNYRIFSADDFFMRTGKYKYNPEKVGNAHKNCKERTSIAMEYGIDKIFVTNTFTTEEEIKPYIELANKYGYKYFSVVVENRHGNKSIHNVPENVITKMKNRLLRNIKLI